MMSQRQEARSIPSADRVTVGSGWVWHAVEDLVRYCLVQRCENEQRETHTPGRREERRGAQVGLSGEDPGQTIETDMPRVSL